MQKIIFGTVTPPTAILVIGLPVIAVLMKLDKINNGNSKNLPKMHVYPVAIMLQCHGVVILAYCNFQSAYPAP